LIADLQHGDIITSLKVLVAELYQGLTQKGDPFVNVKLQDRSGRIDWMLWDTTLEQCAYKEGDILELDGTVTSFRGSLQLKPQHVKILKDESPEAFLPGITPERREELLAQLKEWIEKTEEPYCDLLREIFRSPSFLERFSYAPASIFHHNNFIGGLLDHTIRVVEIADRMLPGNSLLITAALLHDVGKVYSYLYAPSIKNSTAGMLLDHITLGLQFLPRVVAKIRKDGVNFDRQAELYLYHCILSHQGKPEWGSPFPPAFEEAMILHYADLAASRLEDYREAVLSITPGKAEWHNKIKQFIYRKLEDEKKEE